MPTGHSRDADVAALLGAEMGQRLHEAEIAILTGHSLAGVREILDRRCLNRDPTIADAAGAKLERRFPTGRSGPTKRTRKAQ